MVNIILARNSENWFPGTEWSKIWIFVQFFDAVQNCENMYVLFFPGAKWSEVNIFGQNIWNNLQVFMVKKSEFWAHNSKAAKKTVKIGTFYHFQGQSSQKSEEFGWNIKCCWKISLLPNFMITT